jgi:transcriptional regulator with XRE-family HTH domain
MRRKPLESLGGMVRERRGDRTLREAAREVGIGAATLLRVESGRVPDVATFGRVCAWLQVDPAVFLGSTASGEHADSPAVGGVQISAHLRADQTPEPATLGALAHMLLLAARLQPVDPNAPVDEHP